MAKLRPKVGSAVLVEKDGKYLLGKRNKENLKGYWIIPGGGVSWGETIKEAAVREIKEETGLDIELVRFLGHKEVMNLPEDYHTVVFFHLARATSGELKPSDDLSDAGFFSISEMKEMKLADSAEIIFREMGIWK